MDHPVLKRIAKTAFWLLMIHFIIEVSGHHYLYNTIDQTVLKGRLGPGIQEFEFMPNNSMEIGEPEPWTKAANYNNAVLTSEESAHHESNESVSFIVIKKDHLLFEQYWQGFDKTSISNSFSMAKSIVSLLIGIAVDRGEINSIDDPVFLYLPQYETELGKKLKVRHLLNMSSGINFDEHYLNPFAFPARANYGDNLELLLEKYEVREEPGEVFIYQSGTTQVLGFLLKSATRQNLSDYASEHLWSKIGAENPALWSLDHEGGIEKAFCCINATARDFARIGKLVLNDGIWNNESIVNKSFVREAVRPNGLNNKDGTPCITYGLSWWLGEYEGKSFYFMRGIKGQYVIVLPELDLILVRMGKKRDVGSGNPHPDDVYRYIEMALRISEQ